MPSKKIPEVDHVLRFAAWGRLQKDDDENIIGLAPQAFSLRPGESELSLTWVEYFDGERDQQIHKAVNEFRRSCGTSSKSAFGMAQVGTILKSAKNHSPPANVRILHDPEPKNVAHAVIKRYPADGLALFELLASEVFCTLILSRDVPTDGCT